MKSPLRIVAAEVASVWYGCMKSIVDGILGFFSASSRVVKELPAVFAVWVFFSALLTLGTYLVLKSPDSEFLSKYLALGIIVSMPISYFLCGYLGYRTRSVRVASVISTELTAAEHEFQKVNYYFKSPTSAGWVSRRKQLTEYVLALSIANTPVRIEIVHFRLGPTRLPEEPHMETLGLANSVVNRADSFSAATLLISG